MDDDNDVLDWGAEEDEGRQQTTNESPADDAQAVSGDNDDVEDSVSLGDEEEEQEYYAYQQEEAKDATTDAESNHATVALPSTSADDAPLVSGDPHQDDSAASQVPSSTTGTPRRGSNASRRSLQPPVTTRMTHALPPKPVVTSVPFLPPSHPSIVEATAMSVPTSRVTGRSNANGKAPVAAIELEPLPRDWETREARSGPGGTYYYNVRTNESTWTRPVSNSSSSSPSTHLRGDSVSRHRGDSFPLANSLSPRPSDYSHSQSQESSRPSRRPQPNEFTSDAPIAPFTNQPHSMSYDDRHYRPGAGIEGSNEVPVDERHRRYRDDVDPLFNPRPAQTYVAPTDTSLHVRKRVRSLSPQPMNSQAISGSRKSRSSRAQRASRRRDSSTDADPSKYRDLDSLASPLPSNDSWGVSNIYDDPHHSQHYGMSYDTSPISDGRLPALARNGSVRAHREREQTVHEKTSVQIIPDSRTRVSPVDHRDLHRLHADEMQDRSHQPPSSRGEAYQIVPNPHASAQLPPRPQPQRRRDRPTRFGQERTSPVLQTNQIPSQVQAQPQRAVENDDPFVPDDIVDPPLDVLKRREVLEKFSKFQASAQASKDDIPLATNRQMRHSQDTEEQDVQANAQAQDRNSTSAAQLPRRARSPLPPQSAEFQEVRSRPRDRANRPRERAASFNRPSDQDRRSFNPSAIAHSTPGNHLNEDEYDSHLPTTYHEDKNGQYNIEMRRHENLDLEGREDHTRAIPPPASRRMGDAASTSHVQRPSHAVPSDANVSLMQATSPMVITPGPGSAPNGRRLDRSPPPHIARRGRENAGRREDRGGPMSEKGPHGRRGGRNVNQRSSASGPNSVPIGQRKMLGNGAPGFSTSEATKREYDQGYISDQPDHAPFAHRRDDGLPVSARGSSSQHSFSPIQQPYPQLYLSHPPTPRFPQTLYVPRLFLID
ncbi:hypothetical protein H0H93_002239 [Arthromyces matolae]|nr:hypothetical protein H0H93_002239 [Arthromyces matolae]